jgi:hypothetical protein
MGGCERLKIKTLEFFSRRVRFGKNSLEIWTWLRILQKIRKSPLLPCLLFLLINDDTQGSPILLGKYIDWWPLAP